jgi:hypothetical protein
LKLNKLFEGLTAICLCLDKRKEHWQALQKDAEKNGINFIPFVCGDGSDKTLVYDSIDIVNPDCSRWQYGVPGLKHHHYNAMVSHKKMIQLAQKLGLDRVLLMEDDACFLKRADEVVNSLSVAQYKAVEDADAAFLGWWHQPDDTPFNMNIEENWKTNKESGIILVNPNFRIGGLHSVIVKSNMYDYILSLPLINPIDSQLCDASDRFTSVLIVPKIIHVKSMYSETEGAFFERASL